MFVAMAAIATDMGRDVHPSQTTPESCQSRFHADESKRRWFPARQLEPRLVIDRLAVNKQPLDRGAP